jgi:malate dehydrogenase (oxaloacetate-decarboxylating)(NADP+)
MIFPDFSNNLGNNMYVFPGIGLGAILSKAVNISQNMIYASAEALSTSLTQEERDQGLLYPDLMRIREVSVIVTRGVIRAAQKDKLDRAREIISMDDAELDAYIRARMYDPKLEKTLIEGEFAKMTTVTPRIPEATSHVRAKSNI